MFYSLNDVYDEKFQPNEDIHHSAYTRNSRYRVTLYTLVCHQYEDSVVCIFFFVCIFFSSCAKVQKIDYNVKNGANDMLREI